MIDWDFIAALEGGSLTGYVPADKSGAPLGHSGVTISCGVDLGLVTAPELAGWPISATLKDKLRPYLGIRGKFAQRVLASSPLTITMEEGDELDRAAQAHHLKLLRNEFNAVVLPVGLPGFDDIHPAAQTVLASVAFQYGSLMSECPRFWRFACTEDWEAVVEELEDFHDAYPERRRKEAAYLRAAIANPQP